MYIVVSLLQDPRFSVVLVPLVVATYSILFLLEFFDG